MRRRACVVVGALAGVIALSLLRFEWTDVGQAVRQQLAMVLHDLALSLEGEAWHRRASEHEYLSLMDSTPIGPPMTRVPWIQTLPYCRDYGRKHCDIYQEDVAELVDWRARRAARRLARGVHPRCPPNASSPIVVYLSDFPWG